MRVLTFAFPVVLGAVVFAGCSNKAATPAEPAPAPEAAAEAEPAPEPAAAAVPERGDDADRESKNGHLTATIGGVAVDVRFGRPNVKGRSIFGELVPWDQVWRTGANEATTVSFDKDVTVAGAPLAAGVYSMFTIPNGDEWTIIFNKTASQWGAYKYDEAEDALRVKVKPQAGEATETLDITADEGALTLRWAETAVAIPVAAQ